MKMHLLNILNQLGATETEKELIAHQFSKSVPHHADVVNAFHDLRSKRSPKA
jgi:hydroxymethylglutaryl-CoA reductase